MPHRFIPAGRRLRAASTALVFVLCATASLAGGPRLRFQQLNWLDGEGGASFPCSSVGVAELILGRSVDQCLAENGGCFVNVVTAIPDLTPPQWNVQNLYLSYPDARYMQGSRPTVQFDLGTPNGDCLSKIRFHVLVSPGCLLDPNPVLAEPDKTSKLSLEDYLVGGRDDGGSAGSNFPLFVGPWFGISPSAPFPVRIARTSVPSRDIVKIDEGKNECAPSSAARSLDYMTDGGAGDPQDMKDDLVDDMDTDPDDGTTDPNMLAGKQAYTAANLLAIESELHYWPDGMDAVMDTLDAGGDVEILISWNPSGGHAAMVTSIKEMPDGTFEITYVDDPKQGNGKAENEEHVIKVDAMGNFPGGTVDGFMLENHV